MFPFSIIFDHSKVNVTLSFFLYGPIGAFGLDGKVRVGDIPI